jgi:hypothetical protein
MLEPLPACDRRSQAPIGPPSPPRAARDPPPPLLTAAWSLSPARPPPPSCHFKRVLPPSPPLPSFSHLFPFRTRREHPPLPPLPPVRVPPPERRRSHRKRSHHHCNLCLTGERHPDRVSRHFTVRLTTPFPSWWCRTRHWPTRYTGAPPLKPPPLLCTVSCRSSERRPTPPCPARSLTPTRVVVVTALWFCQPSRRR